MDFRDWVGLVGSLCGIVALILAARWRYVDWREKQQVKNRWEKGAFWGAIALGALFLLGISKK
ncbi:hypothetical protein [Pseudodesulfovibrio karagichevae]|uniref:PEP-CTERM protein-sorting domain-containing protein n=1 Tax=Pseudodesulfovibrio karagichevae TaxID=3239305 RepID=A0ABV4KAW5_9BACT